MRRIAFVALVAVVLGTGLVAPATAPAAPSYGQDRWALIIGIDQFSGKTRPNVGSAGDAHVFRELLLRRGWREDRILTLTDRQATADAIRSGFQWLAGNSSDGSFSVVHYSGHIKSVARRGAPSQEFLWPTDNRFISSDEFGAAMRAVRGLVWVDVSGCHAAGMDVGIASPRHLVTASSQKSEKSYEDPRLRRSVFTYLLAERGMLEGVGDHNRDGRVTIQEAWGYAAHNAPIITSRQSHGPQHPYIAGGDGNEWLLDPPKPPPPPKPQPPKKKCNFCIHGVPLVSQTSHS